MCQSRKSELKWEKNLAVIGSQSSFRASDLNMDGTLDLVIGAGKNEYQYTKSGVLAFDGSNGDLLWQHESHDQVFGSATFLDVDQDGVNDVFIGGRSANFKAINGKNGSLIWQYRAEFENDSILKNARFNFYNSVLIDDQNKDGIQELLTVNGGNSKAPPNSEKDRYPGVLLVFNPVNGEILAADTMPDGKESYMSPVAFKQPLQDNTKIVFGTGGETIDGHLYLADVNDLMNQNLKNAEVIASESGHGFIAPPSIADINQDGQYDIVAISHNSNVFAIDGQNGNLLWKTEIPNTESSNSFAVGNFTNDDIPDFFTFVSEGVWPDSRGSLQILLNGKTGQIEYKDSIGCTGFSSPVVYDFNKDGLDDAIISINEFDCTNGFLEGVSSTIENKLLSIDFKNHKVNTIDKALKFKNIFTTPWIGDLDDDGYVDIVYSQYYNESTFILSFLGMRVRRISTSIRLHDEVKWGAYMGSNGNGIYPVSGKNN